MHGTLFGVGVEADHTSVAVTIDDTVNLQRVAVATFSREVVDRTGDSGVCFALHKKHLDLRSVFNTATLPCVFRVLGKSGG